MSILIRPLLVLLTFVVIVVLLLMLIFAAVRGGDDSASDRPATTKPAEPAAPAEPAEPADEPADEPAKPAEPKKKNPIAAADLVVGNCIADALSTLGGVTTFEKADCDAPHDGEVYTLIKLEGAAGARYPGKEFVNGKGQRGCRARLRRQATATAFKDRQLGYKFVYPTRLSWIDGDRDITCLATFKKPRSDKLAQR